MHAVEEPQPTLREGERDAFGTRHGLQGDGGWPGDAQLRSQGAHGGRFKQLAQRELHAECGPDAADQTGGQQRVAAELEELIVDANPGQPEGLGKQGAEDLLLGSARRCPEGAAEELRLGQGSAVELAVGRQGQTRQHHEGGRHHVVRQSRSECLP